MLPHLIHHTASCASTLQTFLLPAAGARAAARAGERCLTPAACNLGGQFACQQGWEMLSSGSPALQCKCAGLLRVCCRFVAGLSLSKLPTVSDAPCLQLLSSSAAPRAPHGLAARRAAAASPRLAASEVAASYHSAAAAALLRWRPCCCVPRPCLPAVLAAGVAESRHHDVLLRVMA